ncbi:2-dehydro-3-deoxygluconokinase [Marinithermofilum abyssi]|uniref:2-dehydro-3-deoxygluconokinase n=1 Tax=Marinithermofilum abyssi TaxID=1571185 RepID=A0A8J2VIS4_9BACL|nr:sugar kinase [Marinithermofilum abyssi]GGE24444.1 2-dehydro-3-deoxygluconokinase [Marinithermofilum abyssi]
MDVVTFGETMVLFNPISVGPLRYAGLFEKTIGGAESNVAIGLTRLGHRAGWISRLGKDEFGLYVRNFIRGEGVDTSRVIFDAAYPTGVFFKERRPMKESKIYYYRKESAASRLRPDDLDEEYIAKAGFLHITGITPALSDSNKETVYHAIRLARRHGLTVVFDPNIRLKLWSEERVRSELLDVAARCDIVLPGLEEGEVLTGSTDPEEIAAYLLDLGAKAVVVKLGGSGAYYAAVHESARIDGYPVPHIVDPVGSGDAFAAGFLSGLIRGWSWSEAVRLGNRVAAHALTVVGDVEGLPFWSEVAPDPEEQVLR